MLTIKKQKIITLFVVLTDYYLKWALFFFCIGSVKGRLTHACTKPGKWPVMNMCAGGIDVAYVYNFSVGLRNCSGSFFAITIPMWNEFSIEAKCFLKYPQRPTSYWSICFYFAWLAGRIPEDYFHLLVSVVKYVFTNAWYVEQIIWC